MRKCTRNKIVVTYDGYCGIGETVTEALDNLSDVAEENGSDIGYIDSVTVYSTSSTREANVSRKLLIVG